MHVLLANLTKRYGTQTVGKAYGDAVDRTMTNLIREYSQAPRQPGIGWL